MNGPLVSVVIPCFRQGHLLPQAIESALSQTYSNVEVIVINDGSDDDTDEVCQRYQQEIRYHGQENQGLSGARNTGIALARGRYVHFLDSDDLIHPEALERMIQAMECRDDRLVVVGYREFEFGLGDNHLNEKIPHLHVPPFPLLIHGNYGPPLIFLSPLERVRAQNGFNTRLTSCEDWDLWLRLVLAGAEVVVIPQILAYYRRYQGSMSRNHLRMLDTRSQVLADLHRRIASNSDQLRTLGDELLIAEHRVRRKWLAADPRSARIQELNKLIVELESAHFSLQRSPIRRWLDRRMGTWSDRLALSYFKWCRPEKYAEYFKDCN